MKEPNALQETAASVIQAFAYITPIKSVIKSAIKTPTKIKHRSTDFSLLSVVRNFQRQKL